MNLGISDFVNSAASAASSALSLGGTNSPSLGQLDNQTWLRVSELRKSLEEANAAGDTVRSKSIQERIERLLSFGARIAALEKEKSDAVRVEDFDTAKQIKMKIEELRKSQNVRESAPSSIKRPSSQTLPAFGAQDISESLPVPDPLPAYFARDYPQVLESLGEEIISLLLSRDWRLRESGLDRLIIRTQTGGNASSVDWVLRRFVVEKIVSVMIKLCDLLRVVVSLNADALGEGIEFAVIHLIEHRLVSSNRRLVDSVVSALLAVAQSSSARSHMVQHYLFKSPASVSSISSRCLCLVSLLESLGFEGKGSMSLENLMLTIAEWLPRAVSSDMRNAVLAVLAATVSVVGPARAEVAILTVPSPIGQGLMLELHRSGMRRPPSPIRGKPESVSCDFCGLKGEKFSIEEELDLHFWDNCCALIECSFCEQVVELTSLTEHRLKECDNVGACGIDH